MRIGRWSDPILGRVRHETRLAQHAWPMVISGAVPSPLAPSLVGPPVLNAVQVLSVIQSSTSLPTSSSPRLLSHVPCPLMSPMTKERWSDGQEAVCRLASLWSRSLLVLTGGR